MAQSFSEPDRPALLAALEYQRASVRSIVDGLSEEHWHTSVVPSGWTPAGFLQGLTYYADQARQTDDRLASTALDSAPRGHHGREDTDQPQSVREIVLHLIEETAAHSGHLEIGRELLDGETRQGLR